MIIFVHESNTFKILGDPICYDSDGEDESTKGWTIGRSACGNPLDCPSITRIEDSCIGSSLSEYRCGMDNNGNT